MPALPSRQLPKEVLAGWLGVNLRQDGLSMADQDVMRAINADFHTQPGSICLRKGRTLLSDTQLTGPVRGFVRHQDRLYQIGYTTLYRAYASLLAGIVEPGPGLMAMRPLNDTTTWTFIATTTGMWKDDGAVLRQWGITPPAAAPTLAVGAAGSLNGNYGAVYTYVRVVGSSIAHESNPCPTPAPIALTNDQLSVPVVASTDPQVTHIRVYRTVAGGTSHLFDQTVANADATIASSQADNALGTAVETDNTVPPMAGSCVDFQNHAFVWNDPANRHYLWYSKRFRPEAVPTDQFLEIGSPADPLIAGVPLTGLLGMFTPLTKYRVFGNSVSGFTYLEALNTRGTPAPQAVLVSTRGALFPARDGIFATNFVEPDVEFTAAIQNLFWGETVNAIPPIDWALASSMSLTEYKRRFYFGYAATDGARYLAIYSLDTQRWYFYQHPVASLYMDETTDQLWMGDTTGFAWALELGTLDGTAAIAMAVDLPLRAGGDAFVLKRFDFVRVDAAVPSGTLSVQVWIDDVLRHTLSLTGNRVRGLHRLPAGLMGYTYQFRLAYTGSGAVKVHAMQMQAHPLEAA